MTDIERRTTVPKKLLIFIVAYNHETTIQDVLGRIPRELTKYESEILIIDDGSGDGTFKQAEAYRGNVDFDFRLTVLKNPLPSDDIFEWPSLPLWPIPSEVIHTLTGWVGACPVGF